MRPRNPTISGSQLRLASNSLSEAGNGLILAEGIPKKVIRMKIATSVSQFLLTNFDLSWRNGPVPSNTNPVTKINAYIGTANIEITTPNTHSINADPFFSCLLPVELSSFTARVSRNNIILNWSTVSETNNRGFYIERKSSGSNQWI
jgi:hypothetical protein